MNADKVIKELKEKYPNKNIVFDPPDNPTEIIVEIESTKDHPERSLALAEWADQSPTITKKLPKYMKLSEEPWPFS